MCDGSLYLLIYKIVFEKKMTLKLHINLITFLYTHCPHRVTIHSLHYFLTSLKHSIFNQSVMLILTISLSGSGITLEKNTYACHWGWQHSVGCGPRLHKEEKVSYLQAFLSYFLITDAVWPPASSHQASTTMLDYTLGLWIKRKQFYKSCLVLFVVVAYTFFHGICPSNKTHD